MNQLNVSQPADRGASGRSGPSEQTLRMKLTHAVLRAAVMLYLSALWLAGKLGRPKRVLPEQADVLLTGTFYSDNWIRAHLGPMGQARAFRRVRMVATSPVPQLENVEAVYPPSWLRKSCGDVPSRLITFIWTALRTRPDVVGGFHLLFNGLLALLVARMIGARAVYFAVGGPAEVLGGGIMSENRLFSRLAAPSAEIECDLLRAVGTFDLVVTMGTGAIQFYRSRHIGCECRVISGGIAAASGDGADRDFDVIFVGRLAPIKRVELLLRSLAEAKQTLPSLRAVIVGDGPLRGQLQQLSAELGLGDSVVFAGHQQDVGHWLSRARLFILTSQSEGLSLSMMEAMMAGLPVIVSNVGDLSDMVENGRSGYLVSDCVPQRFAGHIVELIGNTSRWQAFSAQARKTAMLYGISAAAARWNEAMSSLRPCKKSTQAASGGTR
ncbi:MAG TPA: glycosyltransferase family 4 protein [Clostridia bacterium]|nr:glycosyltransferase family 4 protein [Clostridia bacterium]